MKAVLALLLTFPISLSSFGQEWTALHNFGGSHFTFSNGECLEIGNHDNKYVAGHYQTDENGKTGIEIECETVKIPNSAPFSVNSFILKYDSANQIVRKRSLPGRVQDIAIDEDENYYAVGYFETISVFGNETYYPYGFADGFVVKYNQNGELQWSKILTSYQYNQFTSIGINKHGVIAVSGINNDPSYILPDTPLPIGSFVAYLDSKDGHVRHYAVFRSEQVYVYTLEVDSNDDILIGGSYQGSLVFNSTVHLSRGSSIDGFVAKLSQDLSEQWFKSIGSDSYLFAEQVSAITSDESGYYFSGFFGDKIIVDSIEYESNGRLAAYLSKVDFEGNTAWFAALGGDPSGRVYDITLDSGSIYLAGEFSSRISFPSQQLASQGYSDLFVASYSKGGQFQWALSAGGNSNYEQSALEFETGNSLRVDSHGDVYVTGKVNAAGSFGTLTYQSVGRTDYFLAVISNKSFTNSLSTRCSGNGTIIVVYPNPATEEVTIEYPGIIKGIKGYDATGKEFPVKFMSEDLSRIDLSGLSSGIYILRIQTSETISSVKVIKR